MTVSSVPVAVAVAGLAITKSRRRRPLEAGQVGGGSQAPAGGYPRLLAQPENSGPVALGPASLVRAVGGPSPQFESSQCQSLVTRMNQRALSGALVAKSWFKLAAESAGPPGLGPGQRDSRSSRAGLSLVEVKATTTMRSNWQCCSDSGGGPLTCKQQLRLQPQHRRGVSLPLGPVNSHPH
jgi:hypothetical protein